MTFKVTFRKAWYEYGTIEIEAEDKATAHDIAHEIATGDDYDVDWDSSGMDPQETIIEEIKEA